MMTACLADGETTIRNAAREPEVVALAGLLARMGGKISGAGTGTITVRGVAELSGAIYEVPPDRIEAGTFAIAAACVPGSELLLAPVDPDHMRPAMDALRLAGCCLQWTAPRALRAMGSPRGSIGPVSVRTGPFPGFPTDLQPQMTALLALADGVSSVEETVFEARLRHAAQLRRMGAVVEQTGRRSLRIEGRAALRGCEVKAADLRGGAALVVAGLAAEGTTRILEPWHIDRGYDRIEEKLRAVGADVARV
mmetsp:Transcript_39425/g.93465  ORF Transcript_39425/g.93465 Transcript_39425/m.93465 type:complete len:252 (-) Transcript_39425:239-994(-)